MKRLLACLGAALLCFAGLALADTVFSLNVTASTKLVTVSWVPPAGAQGYLFSVDGKQVSRTLNGSQSQATFARQPGSHTYLVKYLTTGGAAQIAYPVITTTTVTTTTTTTTTTTPQTLHCFASPGKCGYPDPAYGNVGVPPGTTLTPSGGFSTSSNGQVINALNVTGTIQVNNTGVTIENTRVTSPAGPGTIAIQIQVDNANLTVKDSTIGGATANTATDIGIGYRGGATLLRDYFLNCGECANGTPFTITDSYFAVTSGSISGEHYEDTYMNDGTLNVTHSVLFNPQEQTATIFGDCDHGCPAGKNHITVINSLLAGGGFTVYTNSGASTPGSSTTNFTNDVFSKGYFPTYGSFGAASWTFCPQDSSSVIWNIRDDDTGQPIPCTSSHSLVLKPHVVLR